MRSSANALTASSRWRFDPSTAWVTPTGLESGVAPVLHLLVVSNFVTHTAYFLPTKQHGRNFCRSVLVTLERKSKPFDPGADSTRKLAGYSRFLCASRAHSAQRHSVCIWLEIAAEHGTKVEGSLDEGRSS
jgi:hypothetical protein